MNTIRVLQAVGSLKRGSGIMSIIMNLYRNIDRNKIQFDFVFNIPSDDSYEKEIHELGGKTFYIPLLNIRNYFSIYKQTKQLFSSSEYSTLHLHQILHSVIYLPLAKKHGLYNRIIHSHNAMYAETFWKSIRNRFLCAGLKKRGTHFFACSQKAGDFLYGVDFCKKNPITIINNAVDSKLFGYNNEIRNNIRERMKLEDIMVVLHVGRFCKQKNHLFLIDIFKEIVKLNSNSILILIGDGELKEETERKIEEYNLKAKVLFLGMIKDVHNIMQAADIFLLPSLFEGLPVVGIEAQTAGLPCLFSDQITKEVIILPSARMLNLNDSSEKWAKETISLVQSNVRNAAIEKLKEKGYDIQDEAEKLGEFYISINRV